MAPSNIKKRKYDGSAPEKGAAARKISKLEYHSSSSSSANEDEDGFTAVNLAESDTDAPSEGSATRLSGPLIVTSDAASSDSDSSSTSTSEPTNPNDTRLAKTKSKRNDPTAFASSISAILSSKLSTAKRADPVLARSTTAAEANASIANSKLETKARQKLREDKKSALDKGRVKDVLLGTDAGNGDVDVGAMMEEEKRLRKTAQRGVVKLFNAVRQAQVRAEEAARDAKGVTRGRREEKVGEMSKKGFLELVAGGGVGTAPKGMKEARIEEA